MAGITKANAYAAAAKLLHDPTYQTFTGGYTAGTTTYLELLVDRVAHEISMANPLLKRCNLALVDNTWDVNLGSLSYLGIRNLYYPACMDVKRQWKEFGNTLTLKTHSCAPHSYNTKSGTLTGTVTFTQNSRSVTGAGTAFLSQLQEDYLICEGKVADTAYKWYRVAHIDSDTSLTLYEPFEETTVTDTVDLTKYRDQYACVRLEYTSEYTVSTTSNMPARWDDLLILGVVAHAAMEFIAAKAHISLTTINADYSTAKGVVSTINVGGDEASKYAMLIAQQTASAQMISSYKTWANLKWAEYQDGLRKIRKYKIHEFSS